MNIVIEHGIEGANLAVSRQDAIIIVDTIRASTTYVNAFSSGVKRIVPCASREDLLTRLEKYPESVKSGERMCKKIEGYDYGSSPREMSVADLNGKTMLSTTTNGSRMVVASADSPCVVMGSFCNATAVVEYLKKKGENVSIVCSGRLGEEVIEDNLCAEYLQWGFGNSFREFRLDPSQIYEECQTSPSFSMLKSAGLELDFDFCMRIDSHNLVPVLDDDGFILI
jgi:2-phosphosulfolactate phosphatase